MLALGNWGSPLAVAHLAAFTVGASMPLSSLCWRAFRTGADALPVISIPHVPNAYRGAACRPACRQRGYRLPYDAVYVTGGVRCCGSGLLDPLIALPSGRYAASRLAVGRRCTGCLILALASILLILWPGMFCGYSTFTSIPGLIGLAAGDLTGAAADRIGKKARPGGCPAGCAAASGWLLPFPGGGDRSDHLAFRHPAPC